LLIVQCGAKRTHVFQIIVTLFIFNTKKIILTPKQPVINAVLITYIRTLHMYVCIYMYACMYMYVCIMYVRTYVCMCVCMYVCMYVCMFVCDYLIILHKSVSHEGFRSFNFLQPFPCLLLRQDVRIYPCTFTLNHIL
jgi:hypothetical protein